MRLNTTCESSLTVKMKTQTSLQCPIQMFKTCTLLIYKYKWLFSTCQLNLNLGIPVIKINVYKPRLLLCMSYVITAELWIDLMYIKSISPIDSVLVNFVKRKKLYICETNQFSPILSWFSQE